MIKCRMIMREEYIKPEIMIVDFEADCGILATSSLILDLDEAEEAEDGACFDAKDRNDWGNIW